VVPDPPIVHGHERALVACRGLVAAHPGTEEQAAVDPRGDRVTFAVEPVDERLLEHRVDVAGGDGALMLLVQDGCDRVG